MRCPARSAEPFQHVKQALRIHTFLIDRHADGNRPALAQHVKNEGVCRRFDDHDITMPDECGDGERQSVSCAGNHGHRLRVVRPVGA